MDMRKLLETIKDYTFCFAVEGGEGLSLKENCACGAIKCCQEYKDSHRFQRRFAYVKNSGVTDRDEIIKIIRSEFADSKWYKNNVIE